MDVIELDVVGCARCGDTHRKLFPKGLAVTMRSIIAVLLLASVAFGQRISDPSVPDLNANDVTDASKIRIYAADIQASTPGIGKDIGLDQIQLAVQSQVIEATSHGLVSGDVGKPLHGTSIYDDTNSAHRVDWVLVQAIDVDNIRVMPMGGVVDVPVSMLEGGASYDVSTSGRYVYWDASVGDYVPVKPADAVEESVPVLVVMRVGVSSFRAVVALRGPPNSTDTITIRGAGVAAIDNARFAAAVSTLNAKGRGAVEIVGKCVLNASHNFLAPVSIRGRLGTDPEIELVDNASIGWNRNYSVFSQTSRKISPTAASASTLEVPGGFLAAGDWFCVLADDVLTGFSFSPSLEHSPAEVHQVKEFRATSSPQSFTVDAGTDVCTSQSHHLDDNTVVTVATSGTFPGGLAAGEYYVRDSNYVTGRLESIDTGTETITSTAHGRSNGQIVTVVSSATLPGGLTAGTSYYVINAATNTFQLSLTNGGAAVNLTSAGTGVHYWKFSTTFKLAATPGGTAINITSVGSGTHTIDGPDYVIFDDVVIDPLTVNPRIVKLDMLSGITVQDITLGWSGSAAPTLASLDFRTCENVVVQNVKWEAPAPNEALFNYSANCLVTNCVIQNKKSYDSGEGYGVIAGLVNRFTFSDSVGVGCRHLFTTTAPSTGSVRWGTPRNVVVDNVQASMNGSATSSLVPFDTHEAGYAVTFQNCVAVAPSEANPLVPINGASNRGFQSRSRATIFRNCTVIGSGLTNGIYIQGEDNVVENCNIRNCWRGIMVIEDAAGGTRGLDRCRIRNCVIDDCVGSGVYLEHGEGHVVSNCEFNNCGQGASGEGASAIFIESSTPDNIRITFNDLQKTTNKFSVGGTVFNPTQVLMTGNNLRGYQADGTSTDSGFDPASSAAVSLQTQADTYNFTD